MMNYKIKRQFHEHLITLPGTRLPFACECLGRGYLENGIIVFSRSQHTKPEGVDQNPVSSI